MSSIWLFQAHQHLYEINPGMSVGGTYCGIITNMLAKRSNSDTFGSILCVLDLRGFASHGLSGTLWVE